MAILIIFLLIILNGIFAMSEMALVSARKFKLEKDKKKGSKNAKTALKLSKKPTKFLSTVQIGITLIGVLLGVYSGDALTEDVANLLNQVAFLQSYSRQISQAFIVVSVTFFTIVLGELFPKRVGMSFPEKISKLLARPMNVLSTITSPFVGLLTFSNNVLTKLFGISNEDDETVSEEEIKEIIRDSAESGEIQDIEQNIAERVFELDDRGVSSILTHRKDIVFFTLDDSWEDVQEKITNNKHSAYPVSEDEDLNNFIGIVLLKDLFAKNKDEELDLTKYIVKPILFEEGAYAFEILESFKKKELHYGMVVDEYGFVKGMVTMDDIMDVIIGDSPEFYQKEFKMVKKDENTWVIDGQFKLREFAKYFNLQLKKEIYEKFTTITGLVIKKISRVPEVGDKLLIADYELKVINKVGQRIDKILVTKKKDS